MIIYHETINNFINACSIINQDGECIEIGDEVKQAMYNAGIRNFDISQEKAWRKSLPFVAKVLQKTSIDKNVKVAIEYKINQQKTRIDFLIYGIDDSNNKNVIIIELKQWSNVLSSKLPEYVFVNVAKNRFEDHWHPSYQAYNYARSIQNFNVFVRKEPVNLHSCSYLHNMDENRSSLLDNLSIFPLVKENPCFLEDDANKLISFLEKYVKHPSSDLLYRIEDSELIPSDLLSKMLLNALKGNEFFGYDDAQKKAITTIVQEARDAKYCNRKETIIIKGGAGTGKSVVAINALGLLLNPKKGEGKKLNAAYFTSNAAPRNSYTKELHGNDYKNSEINVLFKHPLVLKNAKENEFDCCLFDEAHRIFDFKGGTGLTKGDHLFRKTIEASLVSVFFIDEDQAVTCNDYATIDKIRDMARKCHSTLIEGPELELTSQFRCLGGDNYTSFIKYLLGYNNNKILFNVTKNKYEFKVFDSPKEMFDLIKSKDDEEKKKYEQEIQKNKGVLLSSTDISGRCRLVAGYTHKWISKNEDRNGLDFDFDYQDGFKAKWNLNKPNNYSWVEDPYSINEIGCIHTCQGLDLNYCGVIIGKDLIYRNGEIVIDTEQHPSSDKAYNSKTPRDLVRKIIRNTYYVLLTRGIKGCYVYCEDKALNDYIKTLIVS